MKRAHLFALLAFAAFSIPAIAKADCGVHEIKMDTPTLLAIEAMPLTPENVDINHDGSRVTRLVNIPAFQPCPDDSQAKQFATWVLMKLWRGALGYQNRYARVRALGSSYFANIPGAAQANSPACAPADTDQLREFMFVDWGDMLSWNGAASVQDMRRMLASLPYYAHAMGLWKAMGAQLGISFPPLQENAHTAEAEAFRYQTLAAAAAAHVPDGVSCGV